MGASPVGTECARAVSDGREDYKGMSIADMLTTMLLLLYFVMGVGAGWMIWG